MSRIKIIKEMFYVNTSKVSETDIQIPNSDLIISTVKLENSETYDFCGIINESALLIRLLRFKIKIVNGFENNLLKANLFSLYMAGDKELKVKIITSLKSKIINSTDINDFIFIKAGLHYIIKNQKLIKISKDNKYKCEFNEEDKLLTLNRFYLPWFELFI